MSRIRLKLKNVSEIVGTEELGLLILTDEQEALQLSVVCDRDMLFQFGLRLQNVPITDTLLPEVLCKLLAMQTTLHFDIVIHDIVDGQYRTVLLNRDTLQTLPIRASDAILLSYIHHIPIYIEEDLMRRQSTPYKENSHGMALPVNSLSDDMLQLALDHAVAEERYELASYLRDEMNKRKQHN